ncbi:anti-repressor SinI family protein [Virgibacillus halophilus]|uniref:Anti-repressor SinI family protein n=1 Tax=Tigheibacillus halophilus TaxID=361280 RepID=A0ABU5C1T7_9BACI|nr:anti-repressor SinI family protein [Virgibacillus halophilus]
MFNRGERQFLDNEWVELITEAKEAGMTADQVKQVLKILQMDTNQQHLA